MSAYIQALWAAALSCESQSEVSKPLYSDGGSGVIFNLQGELKIGDQVLPEGVILLPVSSKAEQITLQPGAKLAGVRFLPAIGFGILGNRYEQPELLHQSDKDLFKLRELFQQLKLVQSDAHIIDCLNTWVSSQLDFTNVIPNSLEQALKHVETAGALANISDVSQLSQRQTERLFKQWLGITAKHYQRIIRVKRAIAYIKAHKQSHLAQVAQEFGFSDQAHMTREFRAIASVTPNRIIHRKGG